jgi:hypothetical protein
MSMSAELKIIINITMTTLLCFFKDKEKIKKLIKNSVFVEKIWVQQSLVLPF